MDNAPFEDDAELLRSCIRKDHASWSHFTGKYSGLILASIGNRLRAYAFNLKSEDLKDIQHRVLSLIW